MPHQRNTALQFYFQEDLFIKFELQNAGAEYSVVLVHTGSRNVRFMTPIKILLKFHIPTAGIRNGDKFHISGRPSPCKLSLTKQC